MLPASVVRASDACQLAVPFISLAAYVPQWIKLCRTRSSASISLRSWCLWTVTSAFALFYAIVQLLLHDSGWALVVSTVMTFGFVLVTLYLVVKFRRAPVPAENERNRSASSGV